MSRRRPSSSATFEQLDLCGFEGWSNPPATGPLPSQLDLLNAWRGVMRFLGLGDDLDRRGGGA